MAGTIEGPDEHAFRLRQQATNTSFLNFNVPLVFALVLGLFLDVLVVRVIAAVLLSIAAVAFLYFGRFKRRERHPSPWLVYIMSAFWAAMAMGQIYLSWVSLAAHHVM